MSYNMLFQPIKIGNVEIKNRIAMTSMGTGTGHYDGLATDRTVAYYGERAKGGTGLIFTEYMRINSSDGVAEPDQMTVGTDRCIEPLSRVVDEVHKYGSKIFAQICHPGRQTLTPVVTMWPLNEKIGRVYPKWWDLYWKMSGSMDASALDDPKTVKLMGKVFKPVVAPSEVPCGAGNGMLKGMKTKALSVKEIKKIEKQFIKGAVRAKKAGCDGVEIHCTHGYLLQQFLSPYTNRRTDEYGGSRENRARIVKNIIDGIRTECGYDWPIVVRLTVNEFYDMIGYPGMGITQDEGVELAKLIASYGIDAIDVSGGNYDTSFIPMEPINFPLGWRKDMVKAVKDAVDIPVIAVGVIRTPDQAEQLLEGGYQDIIGLGRPQLADPQWANKAKNDKAEDITRCISCLYCGEMFGRGLTEGCHVECAMNPRCCNETVYPDQPAKDGNGRAVVIVGAGPAGLAAARELALRNFKVTVLEKEEKAGGQVNLAVAPPAKERLGWSTEDLLHQATQAGAEVKYGVEATKAVIDSYNPYAVFLATGAEAVRVGIPGAKNDNVHLPTEILDGTEKIENKRVVCIGMGMTGLETAELLSTQGNEIVLVDMLDRPAPNAYADNVRMVVMNLEKAGAKFLNSRKVLSIDDKFVHVEDKNGVKEDLAADEVLLSIGTKSVNTLEKELAGAPYKVEVLGDAKTVGRISGAVHSGFKAARALS